MSNWNRWPARGSWETTVSVAEWGSNNPSGLLFPVDLYNQNEKLLSDCLHGSGSRGGQRPLHHRAKVFEFLLSTATVPSTLRPACLSSLTNYDCLRDSVYPARDLLPLVTNYTPPPYVWSTFVVTHTDPHSRYLSTFRLRQSFASERLASSRYFPGEKLFIRIDLAKSTETLCPIDRSFPREGTIAMFWFLLLFATVSPILLRLGGGGARAFRVTDDKGKLIRLILDVLALGATTEGAPDCSSSYIVYFFTKNILFWGCKCFWLYDNLNLINPMYDSHESSSHWEPMNFDFKNTTRRRMLHIWIIKHLEFYIFIPFKWS